MSSLTDFGVDSSTADIVDYTVDNWQTRTSALDGNWQGIAWNGTVFAAVSNWSAVANEKVMTSPDGITWTLRASAADISWKGIAWNGTVFCRFYYWHWQQGNDISRWNHLD